MILGNVIRNCLRQDYFYKVPQSFIIFNKLKIWLHWTQVILFFYGTFSHFYFFFSLRIKKHPQQLVEGVLELKAGDDLLSHG